jgi:histidyl-tRNA synthetase
MEALGLQGQYLIKVNSRKVLDAVLDSIGLSGEAQQRRRVKVLRAFDKYERLGESGVAALLGPGRKDESGDFTDGAGLNSDQIGKIFKFYFSTARSAFPVAQGSRAADENLSQNRNTLDMWEYMFGDSGVSGKPLKELIDLFNICEAAGYHEDRIRVDGSIVRGLEYYTGPVIEAELVFEATDETGSPVRFGSVGGGGRYDGLVSRFKGTNIPATGFSIGVSRLYSALQTLGKLDADAVSGPVVILVMDRERVGDYNSMARTLRDAGIRAEIYLGTSGMKAQMKYADRRDAPCVVIQGGDERDHPDGPKVTIKDLIEGDRLSGEIADNQTWREGRPAQFSVQQSELVEAVRSVLARHGKAAS